MANPVLVQNGALTNEGQTLLDWMEAQVKDFPTMNALQLNSQSGYLKEYYSLTRSKSLTPIRWLESFTSSALNAYEVKNYLESKAAQEAEAANKLAETSEATNKIEAELKAFKESIAQQVADLEKQNAELRAELEKKANKGGRPAKAKDETDSEAPAEGEATEA